ncbi:unnamed protein product [Protopolystoma xenopodis]|uniref:Neurotransmitter-gated ion-channel transmembrane domain-containing protein n=1 Tax=Protopolystoma xenopodis TaxID=117903 RepID=A0A3S5BAN2_9PLAT|nr:unnamed protein product [Protopolystoma xenopodis]
MTFIYACFAYVLGKLPAEDLQLRPWPSGDGVAFNASGGACVGNGEALDLATTAGTLDLATTAGSGRINSRSPAYRNAGHNQLTPDPRTVRRIQMITRDVMEIVKGIRYLQKTNEAKEKVNKVINEWRAIGMVLDRLFFVIYLFALVISIIFYFPRPEDSSENVIEEP